jgi:hypothetical protein
LVQVHLFTAPALLRTVHLSPIALPDLPGR